MEPLHFDGQETYSVKRNKSETKDWMIPRENNDCTYVEYHQKKKKKTENLMEEDERIARERLNNDSVLKESVTIVRGSAYYVRPVR